jgi:hypothetical protein
MQNLYLIESKGFLLDYDCLKLQENDYYALKVCKTLHHIKYAQAGSLTTP